MHLRIDKVEKTLAALIEGENFTHAQSINFLIDKLGELSTSLAFVNNQMAISKRLLNDKKVMAYAELGLQVKGLSPMLAKDYISAKCGKEAYEYDLCERCSRTITHTIDALRTAISALKAEMQYSNV